MPLSPEEIESREFAVELRGYDKESVHAFLKQVAADYREVGRGAGTPAGSTDSTSHRIEALTAHIEAVLKAAVDEARELVAAAEQEAAELRRVAEADIAALRGAVEAETAAIRRAAEAEAEAEALHQRRGWFRGRPV